MISSAFASITIYLFDIGDPAKVGPPHRVNVDPVVALRHVGQQILVEHSNTSIRFFTYSNNFLYFMATSFK